MIETQADRVKAIRESRGEDQEAFARHFNDAATRYALRVRMDKHKLSRTENGREISLDEAVIFMSLDPKKRDLLWLATGRFYEREEPKRKPGDEGGEEGGAADQRKRRAR